MGDFEREACRRLPLAESALRLLDHVTNDEALDAIFAEHRGASYERLITFPLFVHLIADALLEHCGSGQRSFTRAKESGSLEASTRAMYDKLAGVPLGLSRGFLTATTRQLHAAFPPATVTAVPRSLQGLTVLALDGKKLKAVAKRLKALRKARGQVLGGKLLVALDLRTGLAVALNADADGEVSDAPLVPGLLAQVRAVTSGPRLWVSDRQFCDLNQPALQGQNGDHWLIRYNAKVRFEADPGRPARAGTDARGRAYREEWGWLGGARNRRRQYARRITLARPGDEAVILVTSLLDADTFPAADLLAVYLQRWGIERMFQRVTEVFNLRSLIGGTPQATVFQAAFSFLLYNVIMVLRAYLSVERTLPAEAISAENLFEDVKRQVIAWQEVIGPAQTQAVLGSRLTAAQLRRRLTSLLRPVWSERWRKAPAKATAVKHPDKEYLEGGHTSVFRLLQEARKVDAHSRK
jgi:DDE family transposase